MEYGVKQNDSYLSGGLEPVTVEFAGTTATDAIGFGQLPQVQNLTSRSISFWLYPDTYSVAGNGDIILSIGAALGAEMLYLTTDKLVYIRPHSTGGVWITNSNIPALGVWSHIVITYNQSSTANDPIIYVNGSSVTVTEFDTPTGTPYSQSDGVMDIGNRSSFTSPYSGCLNGKIFDMRIYNRILTAAEVTTLYNAGDPDHMLVTDGLVFQGPATYADRPLSAGHVMTSTDRLVENILRAVGVPNGSPTIRANP